MYWDSAFSSQSVILTMKLNLCINKGLCCQLFAGVSGLYKSFYKTVVFFWITTVRYVQISTKYLNLDLKISK